MFILGPCALENREIALSVAKELSRLREYYRLDEKNIQIIFKSSFDKANRTSVKAQRGIGITEAVKIFREIKDTYGFRITTDIHENEQAHNEDLKSVVDIAQVPAFLCRQTSLLKACFDNFPVVNVKKGQFLSPSEGVKLYDKCLSLGGKGRSFITERGTSFGYNYLVNDFKGVKMLLDNGVPMVFDATHSVQMPGSLGESSGGQRQYAPSQAFCAASVGVKNFFFETHPDPEKASSDGPNMIPLDKLEGVLSQLIAFMELETKLNS